MIIFLSIINFLNIENQIITNQKVNIILNNLDILNRFFTSVKITDISDLFTDRKFRNKTNFIIIHHDGNDKNLTVFDIDNYHKSKGYKSIAYTFYLTKKGKIYQVHNINAVNPNTLHYNYNSVSVCLQGNFNKEKLTKKQYYSLLKILMYLKRKYPKAQITSHKKLGKTACPGTNINIELIKKQVANFHFFNLLKH